MRTMLTKPYRSEECGRREAESLLNRLKTGRAGGTLSPVELATVIGFGAEKRRQDWLAGRLAAKRLVQTCLKEEGTDLTLPEIEVLNNADGSPYVRLPGSEVYLQRHLSISHTRSCAAAVLGEPGHLVGVDVEVAQVRAGSFLDLVFHPDERDLDFLGDAEEQTRVWTLKESVSKVLGTGLSIGFWDIRFLPSSQGRILEFHQAALARWKHLGRPAIRFDSFLREANIMSIAYTTGDPHA